MVMELEDTIRSETNANLSIFCRVYDLEYRHLLAFIFAIDEINRSPDILPNITLGYHVYDSCGHVNKAIKDVLQILSGHTKEAPNYSCMERGALAGFIGDLNSDTTLQMAQLLSLYGYTQISYGARDTLLSDRKTYPNFFRTVPDDEMQYVAIAKLLERLKWNWVGILTSDDEYGEREIRHLSKHLSDHGICIEFKILVSKENYDTIPPELRSSTTEVLIICGSASLIYYKFLKNNVPYYTEKTFIIPDSWSMGEVFFALSNCSLAFTFPHLYIKGMLEYFRSIYPSSRPNDPLIEDILISQYRCFSKNQMKNFLIPLIHRRPLRNCSLGNLPLYLYSPDEKTSYRVYISVYILAQALHDMDFSFEKNNKKSEINPHTLKYKLSLFKLSRYVKEVQYKDQNGEVMIFNDKGELPRPLDIINWITRMKNRNITDWMHVGHFDGSLSEGQQLTLETEQISWKGDKVPRGQCSEECLPGFRKSVREGYHPCCYNCAPCSEGEISNQSDSELCKKCPENEWPNKAKTICSDKVNEYLSYEEDILVLFFSITSVIFATTSLLILGVFVWFRSTPIVRANNRNLSFILLLSLILSFLSVFLFLGRPVDITCMLQQVTFGVPFTISASSILAKTIMVFIAFKATRPGSSCRKWVGVKLPNTVMLFCSSIQVMNCILWLSISPPFQEYDMDSYPGKIIIQCNEGSVIGFYSMLGYMGFLAAVSFLLAFMVRTLPDSFNEAKYITFSMLVFCSVWIAMIPAYLSTRGKYMVAVEIFAILTSSAGILLCMFSPKLYILLFKPELNTRGTMLGKRMMEM
ncbi:vomeronasal type-2 receptor 26-like [Rana temporaria]|uniref:vomeronasal type-2 receptor 26-like n=1 Tax=Rana temporaria TaxID=8407 RepID=UPI001AADA86B|nr:vomeronasal type-2 receptor 26-like [Rana temporaria]